LRIDSLVCSWLYLTYYKAVKYLCLLLVIFLPFEVFAFVTANEALKRLDQTVLVESYADKADITVTQTLKNNSEQTLVFDYFLPTRQAPKAPVVYWNSAGQTVERLKAEQATTEVFEAAKAANQPAWLAAMDESFDGWWKASALRLEPNETVLLKTEYQITLDFFNDVYLGEIWLADGRASENLTISLVRAGTPTLWTASMGEWDTEKTSEAWASQWNASQIELAENLVFLASEVPESKLSYNFLNQAYTAHFKPLVSNSPDRVLLVMDASGSVYGARLERLKQAFKTVLDTLPETTEFKIALASDEIEWAQTDWKLNNRDNQRDALGYIEGAQAQGKTDWDALVTALNLQINSPDENYNLVWLGDFSDLPKPLLSRLANAGWKTLMIDFWQSQSTYLQRWWQRYEGKYVPLFNTGYELVEADSIKSAWRQLLQQWPQDNAIKSKQMGDWFEPLIINQPYNNKALGQSARAEKTSALASFLPRWWAQFKIADYLRQHEGLPLNEAQIQAVLSIAHAFGVKVLGYNGRASFTDLAQALNTVETDVLWDEILRLNATGVETDIEYWRARPFYLVDNRWEPFDWDTYPARPDRPVLKRWSAAHKNLFKTQASLLAEPLSFGENTAFCAGQRCASIADEGREVVAVTDTLLWESLPTDHWAMSYWADLVWAKVLEATTLDTTQWGEPVSRGQFLVWLQKQLEPQAILPVVDQTIFSDLSDAQTGATQALWFQAQGLFKGYADGTARLEDPLRRIEGLKLLMTAYGLDTRDVLGNFDPQMPFTDLIGWTQPWGYEAYLRGLVKGYDDKTFRPFQPLSEAESYKLLVEAERLLAR